VNPAAGKGAGRKVADPVLRAFRAQGWSVDLEHTDRPGHGALLAERAVQGGAQRIVAVGGDGTVHDVANGMLRHATTAALGVVPVGTGNDFAKLLGVYRHNPVRAVKRLVSARVRRFDVGRAGDEYFVNSLGVGFGPEVLRVRGASPAGSGWISYLTPVPRAFLGFRAPELEVTAAEHGERGQIMMVEVCNGTTAGGAYRFAPAADPADGYLDVCIVRRVSLPRFLLAIPRVMRGTQAGMKEVTMFRTREVTLRATEAPLLLHLDGELRAPGVHQCTVSIAAGRLNVLVAQ
jgi:YegS/Rv2252/BmrU family lipid kinase